MARRSKTGKRRMRASANGRRNLVSRRQLHNIVMGKFIRTSPNPGTYTGAPWWPTTVTVTINDNHTFTPNALFVELKKQLPGMVPAKTGFSMNLRILHIKCWGLGSQIQLVIFSRDGSTTVNHEFFDFPGKSVYSRIGYAFGDDERDNVYGTSDTEKKICKVAVKKGSSAVIYFGVLIRFKSVAVSTGAEGSLPPLLTV